VLFGLIFFQEFDRNLRKFGEIVSRNKLKKHLEAEEEKKRVRCSF
jgi:hypothetical protein